MPGQKLFEQEGQNECRGKNSHGREHARSTLFGELKGFRKQMERHVAEHGPG